MLVNHIYGASGTTPTPPSKYKKMTAIIDLNNPDPATCVTYADDAVGMAAGSDKWDEFFGHYPCLFKDGQEVGRLERRNFGVFEDGSPADITTGEAGDVMIKYPRRGVIMRTELNLLYCSMTDNPDDPEFKYYAHTRGNQRRESFYMGAYKGYEQTGRLRSLSGYVPSGYHTIEEFRGLARANGAGYDLKAFYQMTFLQVMYLLKYKNTNSQAVIGRGNVDKGTYKNSGADNLKGMDYGAGGGNFPAKLFGVEDIWGHVWEFLDGIITDANNVVYIGTDNYNTAGEGYTNHGQVAQLGGGFLTKPYGTTELGFLPKENPGTVSTYFCDGCCLVPNTTAPISSNSYTGGDAPGIFYTDYGGSGNNRRESYLCSRLMYL